MWYVFLPSLLTYCLIYGGSHVVVNLLYYFQQANVGLMAKKAEEYGSHDKVRVLFLSCLLQLASYLYIYI